MNNPMTYIQNGDYLIPDLKLSQQPEKPWQVRQDEENLPEGTSSHPLQPDVAEREVVPAPSGDRRDRQSRLEQMMPQLAKEAGATEELKASDPMKWVGLMNTCKAQAEEILMAELINS